MYVTLGPKGCYFANRNCTGEIASPAEIHVVDTTGAGDIFGGSAMSCFLKLNKAPADLTKKERLKFALEQVSATFKKVFPYILVGVGIGAFIHNWIPQTWIETALGSSNPFSVILATLVGVPMYADIFGTIPVAEALFAKGAQLGAILSFMMAVTTLSLPSLIMLRKAVKPKLLALFIGICAGGIIIVGYLFNIFHYFLV